MSLYALVWFNWFGMCDNWVRGSYVIILVEMKPMYWGLKGNQGTMVTHTPISLRMVEMIWLLLWLNDESICNHFDWNDIRVLRIEKKNQDTVIANGSLWKVNKFEIKYKRIWLNDRLICIWIESWYLNS